MTKEQTDKALAIVKKHFKAMASELTTESLFPILEDGANKTPTPIDNLLLAALEEPIRKLFGNFGSKA